jgi:hypothetical protein
MSWRRFVRYKDSSLFIWSVRDDEKMFYKIDNRFQKSTIQVNNDQAIKDLCL